ncbi:MAG: DUF5687 family protein [Bacteroidetes bacterium]|nr:DUF5687 family protein [Bacteroidota bacterium]
MFLRFLKLQVKTTTRSPMWQKNLVLNIIVGFFILISVLYLLMLGLFLDQILKDLLPKRDPLQLVNGALIYYFFADLMIRFMMQNLPRLNIESYLHLPIKKGAIIHYMMGRTVADIFNLLPLLVFVPVTFTIVQPHAGNIPALAWIISLILMILSNNFLATYLKRLLGAKPSVVGVIGLVFLALIVLERTNVISLALFSGMFFHYIQVHPAWVLIILCYLFLIYDLHYQFLKKHLFPDEVQKKKAEEYRDQAENRYLKALGLTGSMLLLEFKMYIRNKRTKTILYMAPIFVLYGLMIYNSPGVLNQTGMLMFVGVFMTGGMMLNYANYAFGYESCYFDALLTKNIDFSQYIRVKFYIAVLIATVFYILTIPYLFYGVRILLINTAMYFYNIGFLSYTLLYFATFNKKRIDMNRGGMFNYQGIGSMNWLAVVPAFLLPFLIFLLFNFLGHPDLGLIFTTLLGITGLVFMKFILRWITRNFHQRKYIMASGFRTRD